MKIVHYHLVKKLLKKKIKKIHNVIKYEGECQICFNDCNNIIKLNCSGNGCHGGCEECITNWFEKDNSCPECRQVILTRKQLINRSWELNSDSDSDSSTESYILNN